MNCDFKIFLEQKIFSGSTLLLLVIGHFAAYVLNNILVVQAASGSSDFLTLNYYNITMANDNGMFALIEG